MYILFYLDQTHEIILNILLYFCEVKNESKIYRYRNPA